MTKKGGKTVCRDKMSFTASEWNDWKWQFRNRVRSLNGLACLMGVTVASLSAWKEVLKIYPVVISPYYLSLFDCRDSNDPLRRQCFPDSQEIHFSIGGVDDPLAEERDMPVDGLIHRYSDRCLAIITGTCAVYCRHCNRKRLWTRDVKSSKARLQAMVDYVASTPELREVIVSGGDPLLISEDMLDWFLGALRAIKHVEVLRIGSRVPVTLPMRITKGLCGMLRKHRPLWLNTQFNHPREITPDSAKACEMLLEAGIPVSNQSVLLKGINDDYQTMKELLYGLERVSVRPYYLFQCDPVRGTDHFRTDIWVGMEIMEKLWRNVSGLCLPRFVLDTPGGRGKIPFEPFSFLPEK